MDGWMDGWLVEGSFFNQLHPSISQFTTQIKQHNKQQQQQQQQQQLHHY